MCSRDGFIWKARLGGEPYLKPPKFGENLRALSEACGKPTKVKKWVEVLKVKKIKKTIENSHHF